MTSQSIKRIASTSFSVVMALFLVTSMFIGFLAVGTQPVAAQSSSPASEWETQLDSTTTYHDGIITDRGDLIQLRETDTGNALLVKLDSETGEKVWEVGTGDSIAGETIYYDSGTNNVLIHSSDLVAYNAETGEEEWRNSVNTGVSANAAGFGNGYAFTIFSDTARKVDMSDGSVVWEKTFSAGTATGGSIIVDEASSSLYTHLGKDTLVALDTTDGSERWSDIVHPTSEDGDTGNPGILKAYSNGNLYVGDSSDMSDWMVYDTESKSITSDSESSTEPFPTGTKGVVWEDENVIVQPRQDSTASPLQYDVSKLSLTSLSSSGTVGSASWTDSTYRDAPNPLVVDNKAVAASLTDLHVEGSSSSNTYSTGFSGKIQGTLLAADDKVYVASTSGEVQAVSGLVNTSESEWTQKGGSSERHFSHSTANQVNVEVTDVTGSPIKGATVTAYGVNTDVVTSTTSDDYLDDFTQVKPSSWDPSLDVASEIGGSVDGTYAVASQKDMREWEYLDEADLSPSVQFSEGEKIILTKWDATESGGTLAGLSEQYSGQNPGAVQDSGTVNIERIDHKGDTVDTYSVSMDKTIGDGGIPTIVGEVDNPLGVELNYGEVQLSAGFYRVYPDDNQASAYTIVVGNPDQITEQIRDDLRDDAGDLTQKSNEAANALNNNEMKKYTATTDAQGEAQITVASNVNVVSVQAHKTPESLEMSGSPDLGEIEETVDSQDVDGTVYVSMGSKRADVPSTVELKMMGIGASGLPGSDIGSYQDWIQGIIDEEMGDSFSELRTYIDSKDANVEEQLTALVEQNQDLKDRLEEIKEQKGISDGDTEAEIQALQQAITDLQNTIETGETTEEVSDNTVNIDVPFQSGILGSGISASDVVVVAEKSDGTEEVVAEEYYSVNSGVRTHTVEVRDYPFDEGITTFRVIAASEDGHGSETVRVEHPQSSPPTIDSVSISDRSPGPSDAVRLSVNGDGEMVGVNAKNPAGNSASAEMVGSNAADFSTDGKGVHTVDVTLRGDDGVEYTEEFKVRAGSDTSRAIPSVDIKSGNLGTYPVVSGGIQSDSISVSGDGVEVDAVVTESVDGRIHVYANEIDSSSESVKVNLVNSDGQSLGEHRTVIMHTSKLSEDALVERNGDPVHPDTPYATQIDNQDATVFETYTDEEGVVELEVNNDPSFVESAIHSASVTYHKYVGGNIPLLSVMSPLEPSIPSFPSITFEPPTLTLPTF